MNLDVNFFAFVTSALCAFLLGIIWYHPKVMGERWAEVRNMKLEDMKPTPLPFIASFFLWLLAACFYSFLASFFGINNIADVEVAAGAYFCLSCMLWVAFAMPPALMGALYTGYPFEAVAIDTSYQLGGYYIFALVHIVFVFFGI